MNFLSLPLSALLFFAICTSTAGQTAADRPFIAWEQPFDAKLSGDEYLSTLETTDHDMLAVFGPEKDQVFKRFDRNYQVTAAQAVPMKFKKDEHTSMTTLIADDKLHVFSLLYSKTDKAMHMYQRVYDRLSLTPIGDMKQVATFSKIEKDDLVGIVKERSPNGKRNLFYQFGVHEEEHRRFHMTVYDQEMNLQWQREMTFPFPKNEFSHKRIFVDDDGSIMVFGVKFGSGDARTHTYYLLIGRENGVFEEHELGILEQLTWRTTCDLNADGDIICGGFYKDQKVRGTQGVYFLKVNGSTKKFDYFNYKAYGDDLIASYLATKKTRKRKTEDDLEQMDFELEELLLREDGSAVLIAEESYSKSYSVGNSYEKIYVFNDILVMSMYKEGEVGPITLIPKHQVLTAKPTSAIQMAEPRPEPSYGSYTSVLGDNAVHILFNDNEKNLTLKPGMEVAEHGPVSQVNVITHVTVRDNGDVERKALLESELKEIALIPIRSASVGEGKLLIYTTHGKEHRFGTLDFR